MAHRHVPRLLQGGFSVGGTGEGAMLHNAVGQMVQRPLLVHGSVLNQFQCKNSDLTYDTSVYHISTGKSTPQRSQN